MIFDPSCGIEEDTKKALKERIIIILKLKILIAFLFIYLSTLVEENALNKLEFIQ